MAAGDPLVQCGAYTVPWSGLVRFQTTYTEWPGQRQAITTLQDIRSDVKLPPRLRESLAYIPYSGDAAVADDVFQWLRKTWTLTASDPRDKIYALLGMARSKRWRNFRPDYDVSSTQLVLKLVLDLVVSDGNLDILTLANPYGGATRLFDSPWTLKDTKSIENRPEDFATGQWPSWMPDFMAKGLPYLATMNHIDPKSPLRSILDQLQDLAPPYTSVPGVTALSTSAGITFPGRDLVCGAQQPSTPKPPTITAHGYCIDKVVEMSRAQVILTKFHLTAAESDKPKLRIVPWLSTWYWYPVWRGLDPAYFHLDEQYTTQGFYDALTAYLEHQKKLNQYMGVHKDEGLSTSEQDDSLFEPALVDHGTSNPKSRVDHAKLAVLVKATRMSMMEHYERIVQHSARTIAAIEDAMQGRELFVTEQGLLGIGPHGLHAGDQVVVLRGSSASYLLRQHDDHYTLVGNAFMDVPRFPCPWQQAAAPSATGILSTVASLATDLSALRIVPPRDLRTGKAKLSEACPPAATWTPEAARCEVFEIR
ncbi:hypothetical protein LTR78_008051 [Recurvomyces mirabilis]|uniref:Uncharacterized protein n=1 Tax=Recurvomyces mirabilis TaxID=574656 RepID=A0AAE0TRB7_9PEZI|nr:hypothetical protein LTR78_008051 [Recurvomyces mirabilis]KAK5150779.1 hypothetical protein LTS14_009842 [Recurvomyces mirabilis]